MAINADQHEVRKTEQLVIKSSQDIMQVDTDPRLFFTQCCEHGRACGKATATDVC